MKENLTGLDTKEIAKRLRQEFKKRFPKTKFSVTMEYFSMGSSITITLMKTDLRVTRKFTEISEEILQDLMNRNYWNKETIKQSHESKSHQLNQYSFNDEFDESKWCNGVFLTKEGHELFQEVMKEVKKYHYDRSDAMTDYSDTNFFIHLNIGKWDKGFEQEVA
ncbi:MAG: hypothetical protein Unbinned1693contig1002_34 [Prokaryotic dsDNA virus sp.]|jgi:hypothetical protein|nr:MAG: hypothetical protein Unbinned1693contig1002_34 [Prokaryotic dsDNA virus sp.]|tara:strand:+ start:5092 stop:5583 length:492 start_codon:yes stop_codon:yes gene_type:complete